jgi:hypothetical protein
VRRRVDRLASNVPPHSFGQGPARIDIGPAAITLFGRGTRGRQDRLHFAGRYRCLTADTDVVASCADSVASGRLPRLDSGTTPASEMRPDLVSPGIIFVLNQLGGEVRVKQTDSNSEYALSRGLFRPRLWDPQKRRIRDGIDSPRGSRLFHKIEADQGKFVTSIDSLDSTQRKRVPLIQGKSATCAEGRCDWIEIGEHLVRETSGQPAKRPVLPQILSAAVAPG